MKVMFLFRFGSLFVCQPITQVLCRIFAESLDDAKTVDKTPA